MHRRFYSLDRSQEQLLEHLGAAKVVCEPCGEEDDVGGDDAVEPCSDGLHVGDHDVENDGEVLEGEDEHLVGETTVPDKRIWYPLLLVVLQTNRQLRSRPWARKGRTSCRSTPPFGVRPPNPSTCKSTSRFHALSIAITILSFISHSLAASSTISGTSAHPGLLELAVLTKLILDPGRSSMPFPFSPSRSAIASSALLRTSRIAAPSRPRLTRSRGVRPL